MTDSLLDLGWLDELHRYNRLVVGFSGGLDSTVLLALLASQPDLKKKITAVHINHGLSPNALAWEAHCRAVAAKLGVDYCSSEVHFERNSNIEEGARKARYEKFGTFIASDAALILAHHRDDQAETLLLHLFRGAGIEGLAAMPAKKPFAGGWLLRPLLNKNRSDLELYAQAAKLIWIEDESNQDLDYSRNYLRQELIPQLQQRWPGLVATLTRTADHCQDALENLQTLAQIHCPALAHPSRELSLEGLDELSPPQLSNVIRFWLKSNQIRCPSTQTFNRLMTELVEAALDANPCVSWGGVIVRRYQNKLYLDDSSKNKQLETYAWPAFPNELILKEAGIRLKAERSGMGARISPGSTIEIRFRKGGETFFFRGQHKQLKKLLQDWKVAPWLRDQIPLVYIDGKLAIVAGHAISDEFYSDSGWSLTISSL